LLILQDTVYLIYLASFNDGASSSDKIMRWLVSDKLDFCNVTPRRAVKWSRCSEILRSFQTSGEFDHDNQRNITEDQNL
jgi:hypothetical protein